MDGDPGADADRSGVSLLGLVFVAGVVGGVTGAVASTFDLLIKQAAMVRGDAERWGITTGLPGSLSWLP